MLAGRHPFAERALSDRLRAAPPALDSVRADVSPHASKEIMRALATDPSERFTTAAEMSMALRTVLSGHNPGSREMVDKTTARAKEILGKTPGPTPDTVEVVLLHNAGGFATVQIPGNRSVLLVFTGPAYARAYQHVVHQLAECKPVQLTLSSLVAFSSRVKADGIAFDKCPRCGVMNVLPCPVQASGALGGWAVACALRQVRTEHFFGQLAKETDLIRQRAILETIRDHVDSNLPTVDYELACNALKIGHLSLYTHAKEELAEKSADLLNKLLAVERGMRTST